MSPPVADVAPAFGGAASTATPAPLVLHWVFGHLRARFAFTGHGPRTVIEHGEAPRSAWRPARAACSASDS